MNRKTQTLSAICALSCLLLLPLSITPVSAADEQAREYGEYLAGECTGCHSTNAKAAADTGIPPMADISGWDRETFFVTMRAFQTKERDNPAMVNVATALDEEQLMALSVYFSSLKPAGDAAETVLLEPFKWSPDIIKTAKSGDPAKGRALAEDIGCSGCHGEKGRSEDPAMPNLAGQGAAYMLKQLYDFKQGARQSDFMADPVTTLTVAKMADLAAWYASHDLGTARSSAKGSAAEIMALKGDKARLMIGCNICHGVEGVGRAVEVPALRGQKRDYLLSTLLAFKAGKRRNDQYGRMKFITQTLSKQELEQLADYYGEANEPGAPVKVSAQMTSARAANTAGKKAWGKCKGCHTIKKGGRNKSGPNLFGIVGSAAGKVAKYRYSKQLASKGGQGLVWSEANLDAWLENPKKFIGGRTKMSRKTRNAKDRAAIISYLKEFN